jgi:hypothetical protein
MIIKCLLGFKKETMNTKPVLVSSTPGGGTIHTYPITGGKRTFERYLGCYLGSCKFCNDLEEATEFVKKLEVT